MVANKLFQELYDEAIGHSGRTCFKAQVKCLNIQFCDKLNDPQTLEYSVKEPVLPFACSEDIEADILEWKRLTADHVDCKAVYEVSLDVKNKKVSYKPGVTIGVIPHNNKSEVNIIIKYLDLTDVADLPYIITVEPSNKLSKVPDYVPVKSTLRHTLTYCVDIRCIIKKQILLLLINYTKDEDEQKVLQFLSSPEGSTAYREYILKKQLCILDIFKIFPSCKPTIGVLLANLTRLLPRPYSIVNSKLKEPDVLKICFSVMQIGNGRKGLVTEWLENTITASIEERLDNLTLGRNEKMKFYMRKNISGFNYPESLQAPLIMIGPGTGVAPFIGFLQEREIIKNNNPEIQFGEVCLFFGCRQPDLDFIYKDDLNDFVSKQVLTKLYTAFSRVENSDVKYVQDAVIQNGCHITKLIREGASIYVCGNKKTMAVEVQKAVIKCLVNFNGLDQSQAEKYVAQMQKDKLYNVDLWN